MNAGILRKIDFDRPAFKTWGSAFLILLVGLLVYANNYQGEFIFDDYPAIVDNSEIQAGASIAKLLRPSPNTPLSARPVPAISFAINYAVGGLEVRGYHLVNNLIHILAALALFGLVRTTLLLPRFASVYGGRADGFGLAVALLWLVHPLNSEAVNYLMSRTESLMGLFYFLTMLMAAVSFSAFRPWKWRAAAVVCCALGMASKEVMVSAPLLVLLYDRLFVAGSFRVALREKTGFYWSLAATWLVVGFYQLDNPRAETVLFSSAAVTVADYLRTQLTVIFHYLQLAFVPHPLVLDSQDWPIAKEFSADLFLPAILVGGMVVLTILGLKRGAWWSILGAWFFCILAPTSSFIPIVTEIVSERRMYLPLAAVIVLVVFSGDYLWRLVAMRYFPEGKVTRVVPVLALIVIASIFSALSFTRNRDYRSAVNIWSDTVAKRPGNYRAQENLGKALGAEGRFQEAVAPMQAAIALFPGEKVDPELYANLAYALTQTGNFEDAAAALEEALKLRPDDPLDYYNLGNARLRLNDQEGAASAFRKALTIDPNLAQAHGNLGLLLMQKGDLAEAEQHFLALSKLLPGDAVARKMLTDLRQRQGR